MKCFLIIALLCASVCSFGQNRKTRTVSGCGYPFETFAITACVAAASQIIADAEGEVLITTAQVTQQANGNWCYSFEVRSFFPPPEPLPSPMPIKPIPAIAKVIQLQECKLIEIE